MSNLSCLVARLCTFLSSSTACAEVCNNEIYENEVISELIETYAGKSPWLLPWGLGPGYEALFNGGNHYHYPAQKHMQNVALLIQKKIRLTVIKDEID